MSYNLMLVENDTVLSKAIQEYLIDQGFNVAIAINGLEAFQLANKYKFDLIISDIIMPIIDGYELLEKLQKIEKLAKIPVIFLTAKGMTKDRIKGYNMGCYGYLSKPFDPEELVSLIKNLIYRDSLNDQNFKQQNVIELPLFKSFHLTPREKSILNLVIDGLTNKEIAVILDTSTRNVEKYVSRLLQKTNTKNRTLLVKYSIKNNLLNQI
ncbi:Ycf29 (chloroplast) [Porphyra umbilicalis]|uniref:Ycf29 n=1 Tax=Porphyra umbilicalis TaxID=2786 RepID=J7F5R6_PORUM|nr:Ycf29 [Porphyra umbilicalis]AFC40011.1 Ycf29 [Porphyra umbilicalis]ASN78815.1 Ycf29 [Porphyra umbilicalis]|eukprot:ASN78815.1 Ycf29 (chloroplast) [Porphyra umbilicalis]